MQTLNFDIVNQDLNKGMLLALVQIKLHEAKAMFEAAQRKLDEAIKFGSSQNIYDYAYETAYYKDRKDNLTLLLNNILERI